MKIIFAQGNPGAEYRATRHNVGFMAIDELARSYGITFAAKPKFQADIAELSKDGEKILLVKPATFYNETGIAARSLIDFYKLTPVEDMLVIHDELALPFGTIRVRQKGSDAGNNGIKSLNAHIGEHYARLRVGIHAPEHIGDDAGYVLSRFGSREVKLLESEVVPKIHELINDFLTGQLKDTSYTTLPKEQEPSS